MEIWDWVLDVYARPGVPAATLALQDAYGQNTPYLLWAVHARADDLALLARAAAAARSWDSTALTALRGVRRGLKPALPPFPETAREALRESVKALELASERLLMETLDSMSPRNGKADALAALTQASRAWGLPVPDAALADLAAALSLDRR